MPAGGWTLTSNDPTNVTFVEKDKFVSNDVQALVDAGYWFDGYNGISTLDKYNNRRCTGIRILKRKRNWKATVISRFH